MALRDSRGLTQRRIASVMSSSGKANKAQLDHQGFFPDATLGWPAVRPGGAIEHLMRAFHQAAMRCGFQVLRPAPGSPGWSSVYGRG